MNTPSASNRLPLLAAFVAILLLAGIGAYLYLQQPATAAADDKAASASSEAESALVASGMDAKDRAAMEAVVRAYILEHPEIITEAVAILQQRDTVKRLEAAGGSLLKPFPGAESGNPNGDVTLVEFTDYSCGYCRASVADVNRLVSDDPNIRVVYRELPILSPASREAALWALAAAKQGKHKAFHDAMFAAGRPDPSTIRAAASRAGLNLAAAESFAKSKEANAEIDSNLSMMQQIGFNGTPTFIVKDQLLEGAVGYDMLKDAIGKAREKA